jgi:hypothetical protein
MKILVLVLTLSVAGFPTEQRGARHARLQSG